MKKAKNAGKAAAAASAAKAAAGNSVLAALAVVVRGPVATAAAAGYAQIDTLPAAHTLTESSSRRDATCR